MRKLSLILAFLLLVSLSALSQASLTIKGKQTRGVPGRSAILKSDGVKLPRAGTIVEAVSGGQGFWIEDDQGVVMEYHDTRTAVGKPLDAGGPYRIYPFLKKDQNEASSYIRVSIP